jgi:phosphate transport system substrate-binding protein
MKDLGRSLLLLLVLVPTLTWGGEDLRVSSSTLAAPLLRHGGEPALGPRFSVQTHSAGKALRLWMDRKVLFAVVESPLTPTDWKELLARPAVQLPIAIGAVAVVYNAPGVPEGLKLSPGLLSRIFSGEVKNWNDPRIAQTNPEIFLPALPIHLVPKAQGSGLRDLFPTLLMRLDDDWVPTDPGASALAWPVGKKVGDDAEALRALEEWPGTLAVLDLPFVSERGLPTAALLNQAGRYVRPSPESLAAAASDLPRLPDNFEVALMASGAPEAYPLASFIWLMGYRDPGKVFGARGKKVAEFLGSVLPPGPGPATGMGFAPLPGHLRDQIMERAGTMVQDRP